MGRKPSPPDLREAKGNTGKRRVAKAPVIEPVSGKILAPRWLKKSKSATEMWNVLVPLLEKLNAITPIDAFPLARYCRYSAQWVAASEAVEREGTWFNGVGTNGEPTKKRHPALQACLDLDRALREIEAAFGMRPDARYKMLRDQASLNGLGGLLDNLPASPKQDMPMEEESPIGMLAREGAMRPN